MKMTELQVLERIQDQSVVAARRSDDVPSPQILEQIVKIPIVVQQATVHEFPEVHVVERVPRRFCAADGFFAFDVTAVARRSRRNPAANCHAHCVGSPAPQVWEELEESFRVAPLEAPAIV